jgi:hypothetical protein
LWLEGSTEAQRPLPAYKIVSSSSFLAREKWRACSAHLQVDCLLVS